MVGIGFLAALPYITGGLGIAKGIKDLFGGGRGETMATAAGGYQAGQQAGRIAENDARLQYAQQEEQARQQAERRAMMLMLMQQGTPDRTISFGAAPYAPDKLPGGSMTRPGTRFDLSPELLEVLMRDRQVMGSARPGFEDLWKPAGMGEKAAGVGGTVMALLDALSRDREPQDSNESSILPSTPLTPWAPSPGSLPSQPINAWASLPGAPRRGM